MQSKDQTNSYDRFQKSKTLRNQEPKPLPPPSRSSLASQIKELASQEEDTSKDSADSDDFSSDEEIEEVFNKLGELAGLIGQQRTDLDKIFEKLKSHEEAMESNKKNTKELMEK